MAQGYLVSLGDGALNGGDAIGTSPVTFVSESAIGGGSWTYSGTNGAGQPVSNATVTGTYHLATNGDVYFVPSGAAPQAVTSAAAASAPSYDSAVFGSNGNNTINEDGGSDLIYSGSTRSETGTGNDTIDAGGGNDTILSGDGNDSVIGGGGEDTLFGGAGNDVLHGDDPTPAAGGAEDLNWSAQGGNGTNLAGGFVQDTGGMNVRVTYTDTGAGTSFETSTNTQYRAAGETFSTTSSGALSGTGNGPTSTTSITFDAEPGTGLSNEVTNVRFRLNDVDTSQWRDIVTIRAYDADGNPVPVSLTAAGNDSVAGGTVTAGPTADTAGSAQGSVLVEIPGPVHHIEIDYGNLASGSQVVYVTDVQFVAVAAPEGADSISGGDGADTIFGGGGNDRLGGDGGNDSVAGGTGDDSIEGGAGADSLLGEAGNDTLAGGAGADQLFGGDGADRFLILDTAEGETVTGGEGGTDQDTIAFQTAGTSAGVTVTFTGSEAGTYVFAATPSGLANGAGSFTQIERVEGTSYADTLNAAAATSAATLLGLGGHDVLTGGSAADALFGGDGNDTLAGGAGADSLSGGSGMDFADYSASGAGVTVDLAAGTGSGGHAQGDTLAGIDGIVGSAFGDTLLGFDGESLDPIDGYTNVFYGGGGDDLLDGRGGSDTLFGGAGADSLIGGAGNDRLSGDDGDDRLAGGAGNDSIAGGAGQDVIVVAASEGVDAIDGGSAGTDSDTLRLDAPPGGAGATVTFTSTESGSFGFGTGSGSFSEIERLETGGGADRIDASAATGGVSVASGDGADSVLGGAGADRIDGGEGADRLSGGGGADTILGGAGDDTIEGGTGADRLEGGAGADRLTVAQGDDAFGGDGDDTFTLADLGEAGTGTITVTGGNGGQTLGDTLRLGTLADLRTLTITGGSAATGYTGFVTLDDGSLLRFSEIETIICFAAGTRIATPRGARPVEALRPGDLVVTRDHGLRPVRWTGRRTVPAAGRLAPIRIRPGVVPGLDRDLLVSPQHRMLFQGYRAELLFGEREVLVPARHLVDGRAVTREEGGQVTYVHLLFDMHEIIYAEGAATESFHPGSIGLSAVEDAAREELFALFPDLRTLPGSYGDTARRCLKEHEARLLR